MKVGMDCVFIYWLGGSYSYSCYFCYLDKMTVEELIEQLNKFDKNKTVILLDNYGYVQPVVKTKQEKIAGIEYVRIK